MSMNKDEIKQALLIDVYEISRDTFYYENDSFLFLIETLIDKYEHHINYKCKYLSHFIDEHISFLMEDGYYYYFSDGERSTNALYIPEVFEQIFKYVDVSDSTKILIMMKYGEFDGQR